MIARIIIIVCTAYLIFLADYERVELYVNDNKYELRITNVIPIFGEYSSISFFDDGFMNINIDSDTDSHVAGDENQISHLSLSETNSQGVKNIDYREYNYDCNAIKSLKSKCENAKKLFHSKYDKVKEMYIAEVKDFTE